MSQRNLPLNKIICGECVEVLESMFPDDCIDLTVTSPPYDKMTDELVLIPGGLREYEGYSLDFGALARQLWRVTKVGGVVVWVVGDMTVNGSETLTSFRQALYFRELGFNVETMIYQVRGTGAKGSNRLYWQAFEYMFVLGKGRIKTVNLIKDRIRKDKNKIKLYSGRVDDRGHRNQYRKVTRTDDYMTRNNVWEYAVGLNSGTKDRYAYDHSALFPEALATDHIRSWSNADDVIFDPMMGSGTVAKMAYLLERNYVGIEISEHYCEIARRRVADATMPIFEAMEVKQEQGRLF